jgi:aromatic ring-opening dioxygenase catalytic subunit (LigB family)
MAELVMTMGTSHSPVLALSAPEWEARAINDRANPMLYDTDGVRCSYPELHAKIGDKYAALAVPSRWEEQERLLNAALDRLGRDLAAVNPDAVLIVGDDHHELFSSANMPAMAVYFGETATARRFTEGDPRSQRPDWQWMFRVEKMYGMDANHRYPVATELSRQIFDGLMDEGFDLAACDDVPDPARRGFGHAFGFVMARLMGERKIPLIPVLVNAYFPPNQPTSKRCVELGRALRKAIERAAPGKRIVLIASGGLSHFVTNEPLDRGIIDALASGDTRYLERVPEKLLNSGSSEIRMWLVMGGALDGLRRDWYEYIPVYRTPAGTGIGLAFGRWS